MCTRKGGSYFVAYFFPIPLPADPIPFFALILRAASGLEMKFHPVYDTVSMVVWRAIAYFGIHL
jgi:hypothetical protein